MSESEDVWVDVCGYCGEEAELEPAPFSDLEDPYGICTKCRKKLDTTYTEPI